MKISDIFTLYTLTVIVKGAWWASAVWPLILGFSAAFTSIDLDIELPSWLAFKTNERDTVTDKDRDRIK